MPDGIDLLIGNIEAEFPQCDPRVVGQRYRHGWYTAPDGGLKSALAENENMYNTIGHYDHATGVEQRFSCGKASVSEAIFVPRAADAPEGETIELPENIDKVRIACADDVDAYA